MGIFKCDSYNLCAKSFDAFYENEKARSVVEISSDEFSKNAKILYNLRLFKFSIANILQFLTFGSKSVSGPHIWPRFLAVQKMDKIAILACGKWP